ncbi:hypothetical protein [Peredibacter starrii]|uniref:Uncharacterized protein n=1 Tax=Peredibacter starrii TaxID=28202 RepID=A0AAX4HJ19_9BACT|nr:hypothetical protein [Peredibacter starrii]WPU63222.1 hypothetical protein SOO65_11055 [Peredibacter starrii]
MKNLILAAVVAFSGVVSAQDMIKTFDGSVARCESAADVFQHQFHGVYRPLKAKKLADSTKIDIEFLKCVESEQGFQFVRDTNFYERTVFVDGVEYKIVRTVPKLYATTGLARMATEAQLKENSDNTFSASLNTINVSYDDAPAGKKSVVIGVQSIFTITKVSTDEVIDSGYETLGSYRLIVK